MSSFSLNLFPSWKSKLQFVFYFQAFLWKFQIKYANWLLQLSRFKIQIFFQFLVVHTLWIAAQDKPPMGDCEIFHRCFVFCISFRQYIDRQYRKEDEMGVSPDPLVPFWYIGIISKKRSKNSKWSIFRGTVEARALILLFFTAAGRLDQETCEGTGFGWHFLKFRKICSFFQLSILHNSWS